MKVCFNCGKEFEEKRDTAKFCSANCRVKWNKRNAVKKEQGISKLEVQVIYNQILSLNSKLIEQIERGLLPQMPTETNYTKGVMPSFVQEQQKTLAPETDFMTYSDYYTEMSKSRTIAEIEKIVAKAFKDQNLTWPERYKLKQDGIDISKEFYTD